MKAASTFEEAIETYRETEKVLLSQLEEVRGRIAALEDVVAGRVRPMQEFIDSLEVAQ